MRHYKLIVYRPDGSKFEMDYHPAKPGTDRYKNREIAKSAFAKWFEKKFEDEMIKRCLNTDYIRGEAEWLGKPGGKSKS